MQQRTVREDWPMEYVQISPRSSKGLSTPAVQLDGQLSQLSVSDRPDKAFPAALQYDETHNLARQAEQSTSRPMLASMFGSSSNGVQTNPHYFSSPFNHHSIPTAPSPAAFSPVSFQLMDIVSDKQDLSFVEKVRVMETNIIKLCNIVASASARAKESVITSIDFDALSLKAATVVGFYGDNSILTRIFKEKKLAPSSLVDTMHSRRLNSGLYACLNGDGKLYLFYWDARDQFVKASRKDVSCNFVRYLIELCEIIFVCVEGQAMEEGAIKGVNSLPTQLQRIQRLQVSMRKESENDLKLHKGFDIQLNTHQFSSYRMVRLPQGLHRCLVLSGALNTPKLVSLRELKTDTSANLKSWIASKAAHFSLDCSQLKDDEFFLLLNVLDKQDELNKYNQAEMWKNKQSEADKKVQSLDSIMKAKKADLLPIFCGAMQCMLLQKHPWEESLLQKPEKSRTKSQSLKEGTKQDASSELNSYSSLLEYEGKLCSWWSERNDPQQRFLFPGSVVEILSVKMDGQICVLLGELQSIEMLSSPSSMKCGPICFEQHFKLTGKVMESPANCMQECIAYFSRADRMPSGKKEPVILNGNTKLILNRTVSKKQGDLVVVRNAGSGDMGIITWLTAFCNEHMSLHMSAAALSHLLSKIDSLSLNDHKLFEKLLKEPLKNWHEMKCLPSGAQSIVMEFLSEREEKIPVQITSICSKIYKEACQKSYMAVEAFVVKEICPVVRENLFKQLQQQNESVRKAHSTEAKALISRMKAKLFSPLEICSEKSEQKCKLKLLNLQLQNKSMLVKSLKDVLIHTDSKVTVSYTYEELEKQTLTWRAIEMVPEKSDLDELMTAPSSVRTVIPVCGRLTEFITLNLHLEKLSGVVMVKAGHVLVFVESMDGCCLRLYYYPQLGAGPKGAKLIRTFRRGFDLWAFDEASRFLAMYDRNLCSIKAYRFDDAYQHMEWAGGDIQLSKYSGSTNIVWMELVPGKREVLLVDDDDRLRTCELATSMMRARHINLPVPFKKACITPDATCLIIFSTQRCSNHGQMDENEQQEQTSDACGHTGFSQISAHLYLLDDCLTYLKCLPLDSMNGQNLEQLQVVCKYFGTQMQLVFLSISDGVALMSYVIEVSSAQQTFQLQKVGCQLKVSEKEHGSEQKPQLCSTSALDYLFHAFDKYAINPPLCSTQRTLGLCILLNLPCHHCDNGRAKRNCENLIASTLRKLKKKGKVFKLLKLHVAIEMLHKSFDLGESLLGRNTTETAMGEWIQKLLCLVPLQIARAENNTLKPMINGLQISANAMYSDAVSLASLLRFGPYDLVLAGWKGKVKVISSMGKQSSGKSYLLNHLSGSLLDVAGGRCTDGVWMTMRCKFNCLYVLLDFEGLGSFERSEQEDMFLSILNAAISDITIFNKKDFHMDKETEATFQRFHDVVSLVKADKKLFKGLLYMAIKDVDAADVEDIKSEFFAKISCICSKSNENFLMTMYNGQACVAALPPFQRPEFQESINDIGYTIQEIDASYNSGRRFMEDFKLVLSQISARDWSSVGSRRVVMRLSNLRNDLESAIRFGQCSDGQCLLDFDKDENIGDGPISGGKKVASLAQDAGLELAGTENDSSSKQILKEMFESIVPRQNGIDKKWHGMYQNFLDSLVERRSSRVLVWLEVNTLEFKEDGDMQKLILEASTKLTDLKNKMLLCTCKCSLCFLTCLLPKGHYSDHSCLGSHSCMQECTYCSEEAGYCDVIVLECNDLAGHDGAHDCKKRTHTCEKPCVFSNLASNCSSKCSLRINHLGDHRCNSVQHMCKEKCSLDGCHNACIVPFEFCQHAQHACHEKFCPMQCSMPGCTRTCVTPDHFHDLNSGVDHFCANEHPCPLKCESLGVCYVRTELLKQTRSFHGKRSDFEYDYVSAQSEDRKGCCLMIPPFMRSHAGSHTHSTNASVLHYCDERCPACDYYCQLPFGHAGLHKTVHGNMRKMRFVAEEEEIDVQDRKYVRGESGVAEMCMMHCKARGRGHTHLAPCPGKEDTGCCTEKLYDGARHLADTKCEGPGVKEPLDEMTHQTYWEYIRFMDPCEEAEKESFALCNHSCRSDEHHAESVSSGKSYCTEKVWHTPVPRTGVFQTGAGGYVTDDGHHFMCNHSEISHTM